MALVGEKDGCVTSVTHVLAMPYNLQTGEVSWWPRYVKSSPRRCRHDTCILRHIMHLFMLEGEMVAWICTHQLRFLPFVYRMASGDQHRIRVGLRR